MCYILGQSFPDGTAYIANPSKYYGTTQAPSTGISTGKSCDEIYDKSHISIHFYAPAWKVRRGHLVTGRDKYHK